MSITPTTDCFWLDPQTGQCHDVTTHEHWLVQNASLVGLQSSVVDLDPDRDAEELHLIGIRAGLVRISHNGKYIFVQYYAGPTQAKTVERAVGDFLRNHDLPPLQNIRVRNSLGGDERTLPVSQFRSIVDHGGQIFSKPFLSSRLFGLISCHVAMGWILALARNPRQPNFTDVLFYALVMSEATLLGIRFALIERPEWRRPLLTFAGLIYLSVLSLSSFEEVIVTFGVATLSAFVIAMFRFANYRLYRLTEANETPATAPFQFSIRQMMVLTAACAVSFALARTLSKSSETAMIIGFTTCFALPPLMATWAVLTLRSNWLKVVILFAVSALLGLGLEFLIPGNREQAWYLPTFTVAEAVISLATLLVVRNEGYRLIRPRPPGVSSTKERS